MIAVFESHLPPEFLEVAAAQYSAFQALGDSTMHVPAAHEAAEPMRSASIRALGIDAPGTTALLEPAPSSVSALRQSWRGALLVNPPASTLGPGTLVFLTRHNRGAGTLHLADPPGGRWAATIVPSVGMAVFLGESTDCMFSETESDDPQVVLWTGP
jgi:hypothetical protein